MEEKGDKANYIYASVLGIAASSYYMFNNQGDDEESKEKFKNGSIAFGISMLILGACAGLDTNGKMLSEFGDNVKMQFGLGSALLMISSLFYFLPDQEIRGAIYGPGMGLLSSSLVLLGFAHSM